MIKRLLLDYFLILQNERSKFTFLIFKITNTQLFIHIYLQMKIIKDIRMWFGRIGKRGVGTEYDPKCISIHNT